MLNATSHSLSPFARRQPTGARGVRQVSSKLATFLLPEQTGSPESGGGNGREPRWKIANAKAFLESLFDLAACWSTTSEAGPNAAGAREMVLNPSLGQNAFPSRRPKDQGELLR